ncbi:MAG: hypothetical protein PHQ14_08870, partial [Chromatiales bacterium]|nr:hypothetical protein [Chromatiales bacterium]
PRDRTTIIQDPGYYAIRNHLVEFLVRRSRELASPEARAQADQDKVRGLRVFPREINPARGTEQAAEVIDPAPARLKLA